LGYAAVFVVAAVLLLGRYLQELTHPADVVAYSGMFAFGDLLLGIFIACLFMIPTVFLVWVMAKYESAYTTYSQLLVGLSLSAPVCLSLFVLGNNHVATTCAISACAGSSRRPSFLLESASAVSLPDLLRQKG